MRKCPKCGGNVPDGNNTCYNCGYSFNGKNYNMNNSASSYQYNTSKSINGNSSAGKIILLIFGSIFIFPIIIFFFVFFMINDVIEDAKENIPDRIIYTCDELCNNDNYTEYGNYCMCENDNIYDKLTGEKTYDSLMDMGINSNMNARCIIYCNNEIESHSSDTCLCKDGRSYDYYGNEVIDFEPDNDFEPEDYVKTIQFKKIFDDVKRNEYVLILFSENHDENYVNEIKDIVKDYDVAFHYVNYFEMDDVDYNYFCKYFNTTRDFGKISFFLIKDNVNINKVLYSMNSREFVNYLEEFNIEKSW